MGRHFSHMTMSGYGNKPSLGGHYTELQSDWQFSTMKVKPEWFKTASGHA